MGKETVVTEATAAVEGTVVVAIRMAVKIPEARQATRIRAAADQVLHKVVSVLGRTDLESCSTRILTCTAGAKTEGLQIPSPPPTVMTTFSELMMELLWA
jgi:hypothetical protein